MSALLTIDDLVKSFGGVHATDHVSLNIARGEIHALIGPNGAGKTTLINLLCGELQPDHGSMALEGVTLNGLSVAERVGKGLGRTFQITQLLGETSVREIVALAVRARENKGFRLFAPAHDAAILQAADATLDAVGWTGARDNLAFELSHGEQKLLELALALALKPKLLLLDEPMAGLGAVESARMIETLAGFRGQTTMLLVEHDMDAVFALADRISVLVYGRVIATGTADEIRANEAVRTAYLGDGDA